jgi:hypothetical protein
MYMSGDTRHRCDPKDANTAAETDQRFLEQTGAGFISAKRTEQSSSELVRNFVPTSEQALFIPRLIGE